ncbi:MAG: glutamate--tRNA ligase [Planctomycetaceae bacterium]|jgi:glutamyl-tRNA synthetase|nr:glutamate--tRNA ligase [Planctomycetaceae bacterium]
MTIRTRFAPSPTGYLHIGGVRTALFCWLFARSHGGQFILRIDDTDHQRNVESAIEPILRGLRWLGIDWDEGPEVGGVYAPYYQSQRSDKYQTAVNELLRRKCAYRDYARAEEIQAEREAAVKEKRTFTYSRRWMAETDADISRFEGEGRRCVIRLKMPREGELLIDDLIRGKVIFNWADEQDHVIQRADGSFIYHLANVVDDEDYKISHVIRAEEHLSNTPRQIFIIQSLGYNLPAYAHLPFVAEPGSKTKLSKRKLDKYLKNKDFAKLVEHGKSIASRIGLNTDDENFNPVIVDFYEKVGYLPEAIINYIVLVGWALDDRTEFFLMDDLVKNFSLEGVTKGAASFDPAKLLVFEEKHFLMRTTAEKARLCIPFLEAAKIFPCEYGDIIGEVIEAAGDRIKVSGDILNFSDFFVDDDLLEYDKVIYEKRVTSQPEAINLLSEFYDLLSQQEQFDVQSLENLMQKFVDGKSIKVSDIIHALRVVVTGKGVGIGMFETMSILGKKRTLKRLKRIVGTVHGSVGDRF